MKGIIDLQDGLTYNDLKVKYSWVLEANIEEAVIGERNNSLMWHGGKWNWGVWRSGIWKHGGMAHGTMAIGMVEVGGKAPGMGGKYIMASILSI